MLFFLMMTANILARRIVPLKGIKRLGYKVLGEFYEANTNRYGGQVYLKADLELFLKKNTGEEELGRLRNYADDFARWNFCCVPIKSKSKNKYIRENYTLYLVYIKTKKEKT